MQRTHAEHVEQCMQRQQGKATVATVSVFLCVCLCVVELIVISSKLYVLETGFLVLFILPQRKSAAVMISWLNHGADLLID